MSFNENDSFDTLMNEFTKPATSAAEESLGDDTPATEQTEEAQETEAEQVETAPEEEQEVVDTEEAAEAADESDEAGGEDEAETPQPKGKKSAQERIREVVAKQREAERALAAEREEKAEILRRLEQLEAEKPHKVEPEKLVPAGTELGLVEPTADDVDDKGEPKYPLGAFDPAYARDLARYDRQVERAYEAKVAAEQKQIAAEEAEAQELFQSWEAKLVEAEKTSPNLREKAQELLDTFNDANPDHMQTLAKTIMQLDNGPAVLEYLADNLDVADNLVKTSTSRALLQLGRFDGLFVPEAAAELTPVKPTAAPRPPASLSRGQGAPRATAASLYDKMLRDFR